MNKHEVNLLAFAGSSGWWETSRLSLDGIYNPKRTTFLLFPSIILTPRWTHKYFVMLQALEILGGDKKSAGGDLLKGRVC